MCVFKVERTPSGRIGEGFQNLHVNAVADQAAKDLAENIVTKRAALSVPDAQRINEHFRAARKSNYGVKLRAAGGVVSIGQEQEGPLAMPTLPDSLQP